MGAWAITKLAYGFDLGEGIPKDFVFYHGENEETMHEEDVQNAFAEWGAKQLGVDHPGHFNNMQTNLDWRKYREAYSKFFDTCPVEIITYNRYTNGNYFLALTSTVQKGDQYSPTKVSTYPVDENILKDFCEKYNLPYKKPDWHLLCIYG